MIGNKSISQQLKKTGMSLEKNDKAIALNILYMLYNTEKIRHAFKSK